MAFFAKKQKFISLKEAAKLTGYAPDYIGSLIRGGKLLGKKIHSGVSWMTTEEDIKKYQEKIEAQKRKAKSNWKIVQFVYDIFPPIQIPKGVKDATKKLAGIRVYKTKREKIFAFSWRFVLVTFIFLYCIGISPTELFNKLVAALTEEKNTINLYSTTCSGEWQNPQNAEGQPNLGESGDLESFYGSNSAVYKNGPLNLTCQNFDNNSKKFNYEDSESLKIKSVKVKFSFAIGEKKPDLEIPSTPSEESTTTFPEEPASVPSEEAAPAPENLEESTPPVNEEIPSSEETLPVEESKEKEIVPEVLPAPEPVPSTEPVPPTESLPPAGDTEPSATLFKKIKDFFGIDTVEAQEAEIVLPTEEILTPSLDSKIIVWYSLDNETWWQLTTISEQPLSNALNNGYFSFDAPFIKNFKDVQNLKIKFEGVVGGETNVAVYLDSVWVEVVYESQKAETKTQTLKPHVKIEGKDNSLIILNSENVFSVNDEPSFTVSDPEMNADEIISSGKGEIASETGFVEAPIDIGEALLEDGGDLLGAVKNSFSEFLSDLSTSTKVKNEKDSINIQILGFDGSKTDISPQVTPILKDGKESFEIKIPKLSNRKFLPGLYKLKIELETDKVILSLEQDFIWGVLAINTDKSIYLPGEKAYLQMSALRDDGHTLCDANLKLEIISPLGQKTDPEVNKSGECGPDNVTEKPDYFAFYQTEETGIYMMELTNLDNGYKISDSFEVKESVPFDVKRLGPTRIYPPASYQMKFIIKANEDFSGIVKETVPVGFEIISSSENNIYTNNDEKIIEWQVDWKAGDTYELSYKFDAPDISPYLYLLGKLEIGQFKEARFWQIASDSQTTWNESCGTATKGGCACLSHACAWGTGTCTYTCPSRANASTTTNNCSYTVGGDCYDDYCSNATICRSTLTCAYLSGQCGYTCSGAYVDCDLIAATGCECDIAGGYQCVGTTCSLAGITISGNAYADEATTAWVPCDGSTQNISLVVNGGTAQTTSCNDATGAYSFSSVAVVANNPVSVFFNATDKGVAATVAADATTAITLNPRKNRVWVKSEGAVANITNTNLDHCDSVSPAQCTNVPYAVTTANLVVASGTKLIIETGKTFAPGGNVTTPAMEIVGTYTASSYTLTLNGIGTGTTCTADANTVMPLCINGGTFTSGTSTTTFTGDGSTKIAATTYNVLNITPTITNDAVYTAAGAITVGSNFTVNPTASTFYGLDFDLGGTITVTGTTTITRTSSAGTFFDTTASNYSFTTGGLTIADTPYADFDCRGSTITLTNSGTPFSVGPDSAFWTRTSTFVYTGTSATNIAANTGNFANYYNLNLGGSDTNTTYTAAGDITVSRVLTIVSSSSTNTFDASSRTITLSGTTGTPFVNNETFTHTTSTVQYTGANAGGNTNVVATDYYNLILNAADTFDAAGNIDVSNVLTTAAGSTLNMVTYALTATAAVSHAGILRTQNTSAAPIPTGKTWGGTVQYDATTGAQTVMAGTYGILTLSNTSGTDAASGAITATTLNTTASGILNMVTYDLVVTNVTNNGTIQTQSTSAIPLTTGKTWAGTVQYNKLTGSQTIVAGTYNNLILSNTSGTQTAGGDINVSNVLTTTASGAFDASNKTITLSGIGTPFVNGGTFTANASTFKYTGDGATNITATTYYNLELSPTITDNRIYTGAGAITVGGTLNINPSATAKSLTFNLGGTTSVTGATTIQRSSTATSVLDTTGSNHSFTTGSLDIKAGGTLTGNASALDSNGDVTIEASGILTSTSGNFNVGGSWSNSTSGTFTHSSGIVIFDATSAGKTISDGGDSFYGLQFTGANGGWTYTDGASTAPNTTVVNAASGVVNFINAKTAASPTVSAGTLNVDWYLGAHVADAVATTTHIDTGDADITISEKTGTPASTVWRYNGGWGSGAASQTTGTDSNGDNPQPTSTGAILIREYSNTAGSPTYYLYNLNIVWQSSYGEYDYYSDYGNKYLTSTANTSSGHDEVIGVGWYRATVGTMNAVGTINEPSTNGSWYCGMQKGLEVTITGTSIDFGTLDTSNSFSATAGTQTQITVTTSTVNGYIVTAWESQLMTCSDAGVCATDTIPNFTYGTYANPQPWGATDYCKDNADYCGFGFTSNDDEVELVDRYSPTGTSEYTYFPTDSSAPIRVMDYPGPISNKSFLITYRISTSLIQRPGPYGSTIVYVVTAQY